jgi:hypothetical protein
MKAQQNWVAFALELVGSLLLLWSLFGGVTTLLPSMSSVWGAANSGIWLPFFVGVAVIASVMLFFQSFTNIAMGEVCGCMHARGAKKTAVIAGVALVALTWSNMTWMWGALVGFVLAYLGTMSATMSCTCGGMWHEMPEKAASRRR